jgi:MFS superfamily sulfate permease-like transporter
MYGRREGGANPHTEPVEGVIVFRFSAPLIFSNADAFTATGEALLIEVAAEGRFPHTLVVDFEGVFLLDVTGAESVTKLAEYARRYDVDIRLARVHTHAHRRLEMAGVVDEIGEDHIHRRVQEAVEAATAADN